MISWERYSSSQEAYAEIPKQISEDNSMQIKLQLFLSFTETTLAPSECVHLFVWGFIF